MKILLIGDNELSIIEPLVKAIKLKDRSFLFSVVEPYHVSAGNIKESEAIFFKTYYRENYLTYRLSIKESIKHYASLKNAYEYIKASVKGILTLNYKEEVEFIQAPIKYKLFWEREITMYDIVHHQTLFKTDLILIEIARKNRINVVSSFWGSDLLQIQDSIKVVLQKKVLDLSNVITVQSDEMKEIVLKKFGNENYKKTQTILFGMDEDRINKIKDISIKYKQESSLTRIQIGYNASSDQNHLKILEALNEIDSKMKANISIVLPLSYGSEDFRYIETVKKYALRCFKNITIIESYMPFEEFFKLRSNIDIFINLPSTDAGNGCIYEAKLLNTNIVTGDWLPYDNFKKHNIDLDYLHDFKELKNYIEGFLKSEKAKQTSIKNNLNIERMISYKFVSQNWTDLYAYSYN